MGHYYHFKRPPKWGLMNFNLYCMYFSETYFYWYLFVIGKPGVESYVKNYWFHQPLSESQFKSTFSARERGEEKEKESGTTTRTEADSSSIGRVITVVKAVSQLLSWNKLMNDKNVTWYTRTTKKNCNQFIHLENDKAVNDP